MYVALFQTLEYLHSNSFNRYLVAGAGRPQHFVLAEKEKNGAATIDGMAAAVPCQSLQLQREKPSSALAGFLRNGKKKTKLGNQGAAM